MSPEERQADAPGPLSVPWVSVLLPVRNEARFIERCLGAVFAQNYPPGRVEVLVIDGRSTDDTCERARGVAARCGRPVTVLDNPKLTAPAALNVGLRHARGEVIIRVDGHCEVGPNYLASATRHLAETDASAVGGVLETVTESASADAIAVAMSSRFGVGGSPFRTRTREPAAGPSTGPAREVDTVAFPAYRRSAIERAGAFDEELVRNQDDEYSYRLRRLGGRILLVPDMPARYFSRAKLTGLARQYFQYGMWKVRVLQKHPRQMKARQFAPPICLALGISASAGAAFGSAIATSALVALAGLYAAANLAATLFEGGRHGARHLARLPVVFVTLHCAYGLGFLVGLVRFVHRWGDRSGAVPPLVLGRPHDPELSP